MARMLNWYGTYVLEMSDAYISRLQTTKLRRRLLNLPDEDAHLVGSPGRPLAYLISETERFRLFGPEEP